MTRSRVILTAAIAVAITVGNLSAAVRAADHGAWGLGDGVHAHRVRGGVAGVAVGDGGGVLAGEVVNLQRRAGKMVGEFCVVRTFSAGVHVGTLAECSGTAVLLTDARRLWRWRGANSLNEIASSGVTEDYTRISEPVDRILLTQAIEVIPCSPKAKQNLTRSRWGS